MTKRMHFYLNYYKELLEKDLSPEKAQQEKENLLVQIQFFQHERLIHLIVTALFALLTVITLLSNLFLMRPLLVVLEVFLLILLVPYIKHYYLLENGTQTLYRFYDRLDQLSLGTSVSHTVFELDTFSFHQF